MAQRILFDPVTRIEGRPLWEMPSISARICGICPVSHLPSSAKAGDQIL